MLNVDGMRACIGCRGSSPADWLPDKPTAPPIPWSAPPLAAPAVAPVSMLLELRAAASGAADAATPAAVPAAAASAAARAWAMSMASRAATLLCSCATSASLRASAVRCGWEPQCIGYAREEVRHAAAATPASINGHTASCGRPNCPLAWYHSSQTHTCARKRAQRVRTGVAGSAVGAGTRSGVAILHVAAPVEAQPWVRHTPQPHRAASATHACRATLPMCAACCSSSPPGACEVQCAG